MKKSSKPSPRPTYREPLLTVQEAAEMLKLSRTKLYYMIATGELRAIHLGRAVRIAPEDLRLLLDAQQEDEEPA